MSQFTGLTGSNNGQFNTSYLVLVDSMKDKCKIVIKLLNLQLYNKAKSDVGHFHVSSFSFLKDYCACCNEQFR